MITYYPLIITRKTSQNQTKKHTYNEPSQWVWKPQLPGPARWMRATASQQRPQVGSPQWHQFLGSRCVAMLGPWDDEISQFSGHGLVSNNLLFGWWKEIMRKGDNTSSPHGRSTKQTNSWMTLSGCLRHVGNQYWHGLLLTNPNQHKQPNHLTNLGSLPPSV